MARRGQGMVIPTTRSAYTDPARNGYSVPRLTSPSPSSGGDPTYSRRLAGIRERQAYQSAAGEAGALTRSSVGIGEQGGGYYGAIREQMFRQAGAQTATHFLLRSKLADQMETSELRRRAEIRDAARFALDSYLQGRRLDLEERGLEQRGDLAREGMNQQAEQFDASRNDRNFWGSIDATQRDTSERRQIADSATNRAQRGYEFEASREDSVAAREQQNRQFQASRHDRATDRAQRGYEFEANREDRATEASVIDQGKQLAPSDVPGVYTSALERQGYDTAGMVGADGRMTAAGYNFSDAADYIANQPNYRNASPDEIASAAAAYLGLGKGGTAPDAGSAAAPDAAADTPRPNPMALAPVAPGVAFSGRQGNPTALAPVTPAAASKSLQRMRGQAPVPGARKAPDGQWYLQDQQGRWNRVLVN